MVRLLARYALLAAAVVLLNFALPRLLPGDALDPDASGGMHDAGPTLTVQTRAQLRAYYHLDQSLSVQFLTYLRDLAHGDLGWSISKAAPVGRLIGERLPWTLGLVLGSTIVAGISGAVLGLIAGWRGGRHGHVILATSTSLAALPEFLVAMALLLVLGGGLGWFPLQGGRATFAPDAGGPGNWLYVARDIGWHLALPALTLTLASVAAFVLLTCGAVQQVLAEPYLVTARAKGLPEWRVVVRHAFPNALPPVLTLFGVRIGQVIGGSIVVERVFSVPGLGFFTFEAIRSRDYPVLQAVFLLSSLAVLLVNLAVELAYRRLDPHRTR